MALNPLSSQIATAPPAIVVVGQGPLAETLASTLAGQQAAGGAPVIHLQTPAPADAPTEPFPCPIAELAALPARPDYPLAEPQLHIGQPTMLSRQGEGFILTLSDGTTVAASQLVFASSRAAGQLLPSLGLALPLRPARAHRLTFAGITLPKPESENLGYGTVLAYSAAGSTTLVYDGLADPAQATFAALPEPRVVSALEQWLAPHLPTLADAALPPPVTSALLLATTPDYLPAIGPWPGVPGLWLAVGLACWGPGLAPGLAALFATTFRGQSWPANLAFVSPARFRDGNANPVTRPQWLVDRQPVIIGPQFATLVRLIGARAQRANADAEINLIGSTLSSNADADVTLIGSTLNADVANTVNFKQGKTVTRAGDSAPPPPPPEKGKVRVAATGFKK